MLTDSGVLRGMLGYSGKLDRNVSRFWMRLKRHVSKFQRRLKRILMMLADSNNVLRILMLLADSDEGWIEIVSGF